MQMQTKTINWFKGSTKTCPWEVYWAECSTTGSISAKSCRKPRPSNSYKKTRHWTSSTNFCRSLYECRTIVICVLLLNSAEIISVNIPMQSTPAKHIDFNEIAQQRLRKEQVTAMLQEQRQLRREQFEYDCHFDRLVD